MEHKFETSLIMTVNHNEITKEALVSSLDVALNCSNQLDESYYITNGMPNNAGVRVLTDMMIRGLIGNIHFAHTREYWNSAEQLRYIINELEDGFIKNMQMTEDGIAEIV